MTKRTQVRDSAPSRAGLRTPSISDLNSLGRITLARGGLRVTLLLERLLLHCGADGRLALRRAHRARRIEVHVDGSEVRLLHASHPYGRAAVGSENRHDEERDKVAGDCYVGQYTFTVF